MSGARKYHLFTLSIIAGGIFLLATEVRDRVEGLITLSDVISENEKLTPESLIERERELKARETEITSLLSAGGNETGEGETAVIEFVNAEAGRENVKLESLVPSAERRGHGRLTEIPIAIEAKGAFIGIGRFLGELERAPLLFHIAKCDLKQGETKGELLAQIVVTAVVVKRGK